MLIFFVLREKKKGTSQAFQEESVLLEVVGSCCHLVVNYSDLTRSEGWKILSTFGSLGKEEWHAGP